MPHVMCGVVNDVDMGEPDESHDEKAEHHRHQRLSESSDPTGCDR
jgi:hypothetical protein